MTVFCLEIIFASSPCNCNSGPITTASSKKKKVEVGEKNINTFFIPSSPDPLENQKSVHWGHSFSPPVFPLSVSTYS